MAAKQHSITSKNPSSGKDDPTLTKVMGMFKQWKEYRTTLEKDWHRDIKLYNNQRYSRKFEGVADTFVPMTYGTVETIVAALSTGDLTTKFVPQDIYKYLTDRLMPGFTGSTADEAGQPIVETEEQYLVRAIQNVVQGGVIEDETLEALNAWYDYCWQSGDWDLRLEDLIRSGVKIGNGAWWVTYKNGKICLETVAFPDFIYDPTAKDDDSCKFMGRRCLASLKELKKETIIDPKTGTEKKRYSQLDKITNVQDRDDKTDKELKEEILYGTTLKLPDSKDEKIDQVEVIEILTSEKMYTVINRQVVAENTDNPHKAQAELKGIEYSGILPGISWANNRDESLYIGKSEASTFWQEQERLNDTTNQKSDAVTRALLQQYRADPGLKSQKNTMGVPGGVIWGTTGQYEALIPATVPSAAFNEEAGAKQNIREVTATDQLVKGVGSSEDITATEANIQVASAGQRIQMKIRGLERGPLKRLARLFVLFTRLYIEDPFIVPADAGGGLKPLLFTPKKYNYDFEPKVTLTIDHEQRQRAERAVNLDTYQMLIADPTNNLQEVKETMLPKITDLDKDQISRITAGGQMTPEQAPLDPMMQGASV